MKCFRLVRQTQIRDDSDFLSGVGSESNGGRWNEQGKFVVYTADSLETAVAECGRYWILHWAQIINAQIAAKKHTPKDWEQEIRKIQHIDAILAEIEAKDTLSFIDIRDPATANSMFAAKGFPGLTYPISLQDSYRAISGRDTSRFGTKCYNEGIQRLTVQSARHPEGFCSVFMKDNYKVGDLVVVDKKPVVLKGLYTNGRLISGRIQNLDTAKFQFEFDGANYNCTPSKL